MVGDVSLVLRPGQVRADRLTRVPDLKPTDRLVLRVISDIPGAGLGLLIISLQADLLDFLVDQHPNLV